MRIDIDNAFISFLVIAGGWKCQETEANPDAYAETLIHSGLPGVSIRIAEIDRRGGLPKLFRLIYDQAIEYKAEVRRQDLRGHFEAIDTIKNLWQPNRGDEPIASETLYQAVSEIGWETLPTPVLVKMAELQRTEQLRQIIASVAKLRDRKGTAAGFSEVKIPGQLAADVEAPEPTMGPEDVDPEEPPVDEPEPTESPEPCPDSLGDEEWAAWLDYSRNHKGKEIPESNWREFQEERVQAAIAAQLERSPYP